ncbi:MAG: OPT/YSL family transporter [Thermoanaerobaculia bacterium]
MSSSGILGERPESIAEFTFKAVFAGIVLGVIFGAANAYLGLRVGMTVTASIPAAVMTVMVFRALRLKSTILEANLSQTIGAASTSLATGTIFTIPALYLWGVAPMYWQVVALAFLGGLLGLSAMIPLRRLLIVDAHDELPFPEGRACAEVLRASESGTSAGIWIFRGIAVGAAVKLLISVAFLFPNELSMMLPVLPKAQLALELSPALFAVGFILGYRQSSVCVAGSIVSSLVLIPLIAWLGGRLDTPLFPETTRLISEMGVSDIWSKYVRYIGAGAVATAGILTLARNLPAMVGLFRRGGERVPSRQRVGHPAQGAGCDDRESRRRPRSARIFFVFGGIATVVLASWPVPGIFAGGMTSPSARRLRRRRRHLRGPFRHRRRAHRRHRRRFVAADSGNRADHAPRHRLRLRRRGWVDGAARAAVLTVGTIVAVAASKAGDIFAGLGKTGYLVGATPAKQQFGQLIEHRSPAGPWRHCSAAPTSSVRRSSLLPRRHWMKTSSKGSSRETCRGDLVATGAGLDLGDALRRLRLSFAIGVYLPLVDGLLPGSAARCASGSRSRLPDRARATPDPRRLRSRRGRAGRRRHRRRGGARLDSEEGAAARRRPRRARHGRRYARWFAFSTSLGEAARRAADPPAAGLVASRLRGRRRSSAPPFSPRPDRPRAGSRPSGFLCTKRPATSLSTKSSTSSPQYGQITANSSSVDMPKSSPADLAA